MAYAPGHKLGGLCYYRKFLPNMARGTRPIRAFLKKGSMFDFTSVMESTFRGLQEELTAPMILIS